MKRLLGLISILALASVTIWGVSKFVQPPESSESTRARLERAIHALQARDEKSFEAIRASFANDPRASEFAHFFDGLIALRKGMWDHAERELSQIEPSGEIRSFVLFSKAELLYRMSRLSEAEFALRQLLNDFEDHVDAHRLLGAIYYDLGSYDLAISHLGRVVELEPNSVGSHRLLGLMHHDFEQSVQACEHYRAALALSPPETMRQELIVEYAQSLIAQKEFHTALEILEGADRSQRTIALQARCLWNLNRKQEARKLVEHDSVSEIQDRFMCLIRLQILMDDRDWEQAVDLAVHYLRH
ncbi:MAG TPA: tetratricopeptide repeat protein, partial [Planctomycetaceae bacterium]|nr:tetratricopeptide repeat protein [Planctomycetaceae bacterium]